MNQPLAGIFLSQCSPQRVRRVRERHGRGCQGKPKVPCATVVWGLVVHGLSAAGSLGHHVRTVSGVAISDSAVQARRAGLAWDFFAALHAQILTPRAQRDCHPDCFYHGRRLLALDGSQWSLRNTAANVSAAPARHGNQRPASAAFLKWGTAVLLDLGTHQPLAAARALPGRTRAEGELDIARRVLGAIPRDEETLLLVDRLYGHGRFFRDVLTAAGPRCAVVARVAQGAKPRVLRVLSDGSALIEVRFPGAPGQGRQTIILREVRGLVRRGPAAGAVASGPHPPTPATPATVVRLWTTLLDARQHPAAALLALYAQRWEQELFYRELKRHTEREHLLRAGTVAGAEAEFGALIIAASLLAEQRVQAAQVAGLPLGRLSISKLGTALAALLPVLSVAGDLLGPVLQAKLISQFLAHAAREARIAPRRTRSCQRGLRKPACAWPRIRTRHYHHGICLYTVIPSVFP